MICMLAYINDKICSKTPDMQRVPTMNILRRYLVLLALTSSAVLAKADTIDFTATVTSLGSLPIVPVGSTFSGFVTFNGSYQENPLVAPPTLTSYGFTYPSAPASITGLKWDFIESEPTLALSLMFVDFASPTASFSINNGIFTIFTPTVETANSVSYSVSETGTVTYSYVSAAIAPAPEPGTLVLVGSGILAVACWKRYGTVSV
jgi:hypothetical protein